MGRYGRKRERTLGRIESLARAGHDLGSFSQELVAELAGVIPHTAACVVTLDPTTELLTGTYKFGSLAGDHGQDGDWARLEYGTDDPTRMAAIAHRRVPAVAVGQLPGGSNGSIRFRELVGPAGYGDELRMVARHADRSWGGVNLFRAADRPGFDPAETRLLAQLSRSVADGLRAGSIARCATAVDEARTDGPAVIIIDETGSRRGVAGTDELLWELTDQEHRSPAESIISSLTVAALSYAAGETATLPHARLRSPSGRWLLAEAAPMATGEDRRNEVVITIDDARPSQVVELVAATYGLTAREREVTQLVLTGADTKTMARKLTLSSYTVQDHLKSIFEKVGVRSRAELTARVFFDQYAPQLVTELDR